jgi:ABC-type amino acid transport substrate-binding protein
MRPVRYVALAAALAATLTATLWAQQFQFHLEHLTSNASDSFDVSLNTSMLQFAAKFLDGKDPDEAKVKKLIVGIEGIYIKSFEFKKDGAYAPSDLDKVRNQLKPPEWSRIVGVKNNGEGENIEVWARNEKGKVTGVAILASEPRQLTVANLVGQIDLESLADLGGHFGLPNIPKGKKK